LTTFGVPNEDWLRQKQVYKQRLATIVIPLDISPGIAKGLLSRIDSFYSEVRVELGELEGQRDKVDFLIKELERSAAEGTNETARKRAATEACQNFRITPEEVVNLYDAQRTLYERYSFLSSIVDTLNGKQSRLITVGGLLKLEKDLVPYASLD
jgi:hypothetical protein